MAPLTQKTEPAPAQVAQKDEVQVKPDVWPNKERLAVLHRMMDDWKHYDCGLPVKLPVPIKVNKKDASGNYMERTHGYFVRPDMVNAMVVVTIKDDTSGHVRFYWPDTVTKDREWVAPEVAHTRKPDAKLGNLNTGEVQVPEELRDLRSHYFAQGARSHIKGDVGAALSPGTQHRR